MKRGPTLWPALRYSVDLYTDTNVHATGSVKMRKTLHRIFADVRIFSLQCAVVRLDYECRELADIRCVVRLPTSGADWLCIKPSYAAVR